MVRPDREEHQPVFWRSLDEVVNWRTTVDPTSSKVDYPLQRDTKAKGYSRLLVCHDYKGGYSERDDERGYTFNWWEMTDIFVYFAHHRVSPPPPAWIRTAHRHGTKILGTLSFEWDEGRRETFKLVAGLNNAAFPEKFAVSDFSQLDTTFADTFVDICVEMRFEGWLVNVEADLGIDKSTGRIGGKENAQALVAWVEYLRAETKRRVPEGEIIWYDATTIEGKLQWQSSLTDLNQPFLEASGALFTDYHWGPGDPSRSVAALRKSTKRPVSDIFFGIDVFGRGQYGGGGFDCWRAMTVLRAESTSGLSVVLFAPGWTAESEHLKHSFSTRSTTLAWKEDEDYLWRGGPETSRVAPERLRQEEVRRLERGQQRARDLAVAVGRGERLEDFDYYAPLKPWPGFFRPISKYFPPRPHSLSPGRAFFSCFSSGSGHDFYFEGRKVLQSEKGWTDVDFQFPSPILALDYGSIGRRAHMSEDDAWMGEQSLRMIIEHGLDSFSIPLFSFDISASPPFEIRAEVIFKTDFRFRRTPELIIEGFRGTRYPEELEYIGDTEWRRCTIRLNPYSACTITRLDLHVVRDHFEEPYANILIGTVSVELVHPSPVRPRLQQVMYDKQERKVSWTQSYDITLGPNAAPMPWPKYRFFTLWHLPIEELDARKGKFLGTTVENYFRTTGDLEKGTILVRGVQESGKIDDWKEAVKCDC